jgi:hypothetical protein
MDRTFKGVWIAAEIWLDKDLTLVEKALLAEIDSFTGNGKSFMKSNDTIQSEYSQTTPSSLSTAFLGTRLEEACASSQTAVL